MGLNGVLLRLLGEKYILDVDSNVLWGAPGHHDDGVHVLLCIALLGVTVGFQKRFFKILLECFL